MKSVTSIFRYQIFDKHSFIVNDKRKYKDKLKFSALLHGISLNIYPQAGKCASHSQLYKCDTVK